MSNVVKNPGFEGITDGAIVLPVHSGGGNFDDAPAWLARPDGFWEGARYSIRAGTHAGAEGAISHSASKNAAGLPSFTTGTEAQLPDAGDAVSLVRDREDAIPTQWWFSSDPGNSFSPELKQIRPGSPGIRSLRVSAGLVERPAEVASYLDTIGARAGKLLPLSGKWNLSFWVRLDRGQATVRVVIGRDGSSAVLSHSVRPSSAWTRIQISFDAGTDSGPVGQVSLRLQVTGSPAGDVLLDDVDLHQEEDGASPFRSEVVATLKTLHPGYLRDWEGQLGDTFANRTASTFARKAWRYRPGDDNQTDFGYGLGEFLELAKEVGASPWVIVPTVFTDRECADLGTWLSTPGRLAVGKEILTEFGNENWNELFRPAGIPDPVLHGQAADRCFAELRAHALGVNLRTVVNGQFVNPAAVDSYGAESQTADIVAVAPYFAFSMPAGLPLAKRNELLFESRDESFTRLAREVRRLHKELAVYEVNLHSVQGTATQAERQPVVVGMASGAALARSLLDSLAHGIRRQCVYTLAGFDQALESTAGYTQLMGILRDLREANHFRPTGLALQLLNDTVGGDMKKVTIDGGSKVWVYAFEAGGRFSAIAISGSDAPERVKIQFPVSANTGTTLRLRSMAQVSGDFAVREQTAIISGHSTELDLAPWSMVVLRPEGR
jgi:hypothetical protein